MQTVILLVEDEEAIADPLSFLLETEGYTVRVASDGRAALEIFDELNPDLVLLDLMLPEVSGTEVCRQIRQKSNTPIIMLTAKDTESDIIVGLELGADDYITKPYSTGELMARVRALLRRSTAQETAEATAPGDDIVEAKGVSLNLDRHELTVRGKKITIPLREFQLLSYLVEHQGRVLTREQLIDRVWGSNYFGDTKTLDVHIKRVRGRIEEDPKHPVLLHTVRGVGYRFG